MPIRCINVLLMCRHIINIIDKTVCLIKSYYTFLCVRVFHSRSINFQILTFAPKKVLLKTRLPLFLATKISALGGKG